MTQFRRLNFKVLDSIRRKFYPDNSEQITYKELGKHGRFGNQLWQIFSTIGIGNERYLTPRFGPWECKNFFSFPSDFWEIPSPRAANAPDFAKYLGKQSIYLQDLNLIPKDLDWIKACLQPSDHIIENLESLAKRYNISERHAVHIRRGDYIKNSHYHSLPNKQWFLARLKTNSLIFSDDVEWCKANFPSTEIVDADPILSWHLMTRSESFLISASSYSWWAAFISGATEVVYPEPWSPQPKSEWDTEFFIPDYFRPNFLNDF